MSSELGNANGKLYMMPKVSVVIQQGGPMRNGDFTYSYGRLVDNRRRTLFGVTASIFTWIVGFFVVVVLFSVPVALTSVILVNTMNSQGVVTMRTQDVPSDGLRDANYPQQQSTPVVPADR